MKSHSLFLRKISIGGGLTTMEKAAKWLSLGHVLVFSVALNVVFGLMVVLRRECFGGAEQQTERGINGFCLEKQFEEVVVAPMAVGSTEKAHIRTNAVAPVYYSSSSSADSPPITDDGRIINLDHGDPTMYEKFWKQTGDRTTVVISGWQSISYFSDPSNVCWFLEGALEREIIRLHEIVGNAVTDDRYIIVGTGSTQLFQAALYALSLPEGAEPVSVVSALPYYSFYLNVIDYMKSGLYKWAGDAESFNKEEPYIELITSPNNPDGFMRQPKVNRSMGMLIHDFAYYWPQYAPITRAADHDLMLFTISKSSGHAGVRIGWALVKDKEVAKKMTKFIELSSIGVSKDSQLRAAKILQAISDSTELAGDSEISKNFFEFSYNIMADRWKQLREAVKQSELFSLPEFPSAYCKFSNRSFRTQPAFAWLRCRGGIEDCNDFLQNHKILTRGGRHFGVSPEYVRVSMLAGDDNFHLFLNRLSMLWP
ncbi:hypothetical protein Nepgr_033296 [Nepenthes gracilis]|uniref:Alliinase C-terminal domain-containing protein n=1 Tax=Nepenthes gracilis TaxID=150966 RepID=A0AAD3Y6T5_NEPGR|nr:hypothetical protein Nepgr_033296 [Nepenthes gracilis]